MTAKAPQTQAEPGTFQAVLTQHRSLGPAGFAILMALVAGVSFVAGMVFLIVGAWPVFGFFGLDVLLIYGAFKLNTRAGRAYETVAITPDTFRLTRVDPAGREKHFELQSLLGAGEPAREAGWPHLSQRGRPGAGNCRGALSHG